MKYAVFVEGKNIPQKFHEHEDDALTEACRLIQDGQGKKAYVMQVLYECDISAEVNKV